MTNASKIKGALSCNYFVKPEKVIYTWWRYNIKEYLLKINFKQIANKEINLCREDSLVCYKIDVKHKTFNICELPVDDDGILTVDDGFFEKGDIEEWKNKLL